MVCPGQSRSPSVASLAALHRAGGSWRWSLLSHMGGHDLPQPFLGLQTAGKSLVTLLLRLLPVPLA